MFDKIKKTKQIGQMTIGPHLYEFYVLILFNMQWFLIGNKIQ